MIHLYMLRAHPCMSWNQFIVEPIDRDNQRKLLIQSPRFTHYYRYWVTYRLLIHALLICGIHPRSSKSRNWISLNLDLPMLIPPIRSNPSRIRSTSPTASPLAYPITRIHPLHRWFTCMLLTTESFITHQRRAIHMLLVHTAK